jgi:hypothetical protein
MIVKTVKVTFKILIPLYFIILKTRIKLQVTMVVLCLSLQDNQSKFHSLKTGF